MPSNSTSIFSDPDGFEANLRRWIGVDLTITEEGQYRSRLTQIALRHLYLAAGHEFSFSHRIHVDAVRSRPAVVADRKSCIADLARDGDVAR